MAPTLVAAATLCGAARQRGSRVYDAIGLVNETTGWTWIDQRLKWTDDAGQTWRDITPSDLERSDAKFDAGELAFFLDRSTGWVLATRAHNFQTPSDLFIWRTTDGGSSWRKTRLDGPAMDPAVAPPLFGPQTLQFLDAQTGWFVLAGASGNHGGTTFYGTTDGGASWRRLSGLFGHNGAYGVVHFASLTDGWEAWSDGRENVQVTHDGGETWERTWFAQDTGVRDDRSWLGSFAYGALGPTEGVIPASHYEDSSVRKTNIYATHDAGRTWTLVGPAPAADGKMFFLSAETWFQATEQKIYRTEDGGMGWQAVDVRWASALPDNTCSLEPKQLQFADAGHGWALLTNEAQSTTALVATDDGGQTWRVLNP